MKSIKEKAEAYDEGLAKAKEQYNYPCMRSCMGILEEIFPELAESEDEKVRQKILFLFFSWRNNEQVNIPNKKEVEKAISWLERQGANSPVLSNSANNGKDEQKTEENKGNVGGISSNWSEEDERVLASVIADILCADTSTLIGEKETASYKCDWLKSIKDRVGCEANCATTKEWSEEDDKIINGLIESLTRISANTRTDSTSPNYSFYKEIDWLKSLKERKGGKI